MAKADVSKPDFAYPKTVSKTAKADISSAVAKHDAHGALNALIRYTVAENLIDPEQLQGAIKLVEDTSEKFKDDTLYGVFEILLADLYQNAYAQNRWMYDRRELPLLPRPADITEWSGAQYKAVVKEYCDRATDAKYISQLSSLPIKNYKDIIEANALAQIYYPTVADFVYKKAISLLTDDEESTAALFAQAIAQAGKDSPSLILWECKKEMASPDHNFSNLKALYEKYQDNYYSGIILSDLYRDVYTLEQKAEYNKFASENLQNHKGNPWTDELTNNLTQILNPSLRINGPSLYAPNENVILRIQNENAATYTIDVYEISEKESRANSMPAREILKGKKSIEHIEIKCNEAKPFVSDTTVSICLKKSGYYLIVPTIPGAKDNVSKFYVLHIVPIIPLAVTGTDDNLQIITVNPVTGQPVKDVQVRISDGKKSSWEGVSDDKGIAVISLPDDIRRTETSCTYAGQKYLFDDLYFYGRGWWSDDNTERENISINILTDRGIYHPGENVDVLAVVSSDREFKTTGKSVLMPNYEITVDLMDVNYNKVASDTVVTDEYGRAVCNFRLPTDGLTGEYNLNASHGSIGLSGRARIMVSDYRMPEFELKIDAIACDTPTPGSVTVTGVATSYSGMPMSDATIKLVLSKTSWWAFFRPDEKVYSTETTTDAEGKFQIVIPDSVFTDKNQKLYLVSIDAVSSTGSTASAVQSFALTAQYRIEVSLPNKNVDGQKLLRPDIEITAADGSRTEIPLKWSLKKDGDEISSGEYYGYIDLKDVKPGSYRLTFSSVKEGLAEESAMYITVYNTASGIVPDDTSIWLKDKNYTLTDENSLSIDYATSYNGTTYLYYILENKGKRVFTRLAEVGYGYHTLNIDVPEDLGGAQLMLVCVNSSKVWSEGITIERKKDSGLKIVAESFRDNLTPTSQETWNFKITRVDGSPIEAALALDMYNKALNALSGHSFAVNFPTRQWYRNININFPNMGNTFYRYSTSFKLKSITGMSGPNFDYYGYFGYGYEYGNPVWLRGVAPMMKMSAASADADGMVMEKKESAVMDDEVMYNVVVTGAANMEDETSPAPNPEAFDYRDSEVPMAVWAPMLTTNAQGEIRYTFTVPNANTTWRLLATAWSKDMETGSLVHDFIASKPVMVTPNLPRFLRSGDKATVLARVMNATDSTITATTVVEIFNPLTSEIIDSRTFTQEIDAKLTANVSIDINAPADMSAIGYRVRSTAGDFTDGEQNVIPILTSMSSLIETMPFYLNPGEKEYSTILPKEKDAKISLTFCENPTWSIVTALPGLRTQIRDYANSAAAAIYSAAIARGIMEGHPNIREAIEIWRTNPADSALVSMLQKNEDLKLAVLNCTPWVQAAQSDTERMANLAMTFNDKEVDASINAALDILSKLQMSDGGWAWGKWCDESSVWVTSNVLAMLGDLRTLGWLPADNQLDKMIRLAVAYYDKKVEDTDLVYCLVRPAFDNIAISANGKKVIAATIKDIEKEWKHYTDPAYKAMAAQALYLNGKKDKALELLCSVSEFGVYTPSQGLKFPSVNALYSYAILLDAYGMIEPKSKEVDGLRQQLIVRKQATDWGDAVVTTEVVKAILSTGTNWTVNAKGAEIHVGKTTIEPQGAIETATGSLRANLSQYAGERLEIITSGETPAYGAVYAQFEREMTDVEPSACDDLSIEKVMYVKDGTEWRNLNRGDQLQVGDRIKVQLTIHNKRNMQYVSIKDERPAAFEPVEQIPGWVWSEGVRFYRENLDSETNLHVVYMSPGTYLLTYEMNVNLAGVYSSGVATIQSQYAPELSAHSAGTIIKVK